LNVDKNPKAIQRILLETQGFMDRNNLTHRKGDYYYQLANYYATTHNYDSARTVFYKTLQLVPENNVDLICIIHTKLASLDREQGLLQQALETIGKALEYSKSSNNRSTIAVSLIESGNINCELGLYNQSLSEYQEALGYYKTQKDTLKAISVYLCIGKLFNRRENFPMAMDYYEKALAIFKKVKSDEGVAMTQLLISQVYEKMGDMQKALINSKLSENSYRLLDFTYKAAFAQNQLGLIQLKLKQFPESKKILELALETMKEHNDGFGQSESLIYLGDLFFAMENYGESLKNYKEALTISEQISSQILRLKLYEKIANCYYGMGDFKMAMNFQTQFYVFNRQFISNEFQLKVSTLEAKLNKERNDLGAGQIELLGELHKERTSKKIWIATLFSILTIIIVSFGIFYYLTKKKSIAKEKVLSNKLHRINRQQVYLQNQKKQLDDMHKTISRYFSITTQTIYEPVRTIRRIIDQKNNPEKENEKITEAANSESLIMSFNLLENLLYWSRLQMEKLDSNAQNHQIEPLIADIIKIQQPRAATKHIDCRMHVEPGISGYFDYHLIEIALRNLIENALKFSTFESDVVVRAKKDGETIQITITDNGIGFTREQLNSVFSINKNYISQGTHGEKGGGLGLILSKVFIERNFGSLSIESSIAMGTKITVVLPGSKN
jgi:signal transduction histidine kinase